MDEQTLAELFRELANDGDTKTVVLQGSELQRIAKLLTEDDARQERGAMEERYHNTVVTHRKRYETDPSFAAAVEAFWTGFVTRKSLPELRALEAAYRATLPS